MSRPLRILSANLWSGNADPEALARLLEERRVDVLAAQEVHPVQGEAIRAVLPHGEIDPDLSFFGMALALRRPGRARRLPLTYRDGWVAELEPEDWPQLDLPLEVVNVHIAAPHTAPYGSGAWHRRQQMRRLERYLVHGEQGEDPHREGAEGSAGHQSGGEAPQVIVGDFNATPFWPVYHRIRRHRHDAALIDAQRTGRPLQRTWGPLARGPRWLRLDHGFVRGVEVDRFEVVPVVGSDHRGLLLDVRPLAADAAAGG